MSARREPRAPKKSSAKAAVAKSAPARDLFGTPFTATGFSLRDVNVQHVQRAQELYHDNFEAFKSFHNFFASYNDEMYREIDTKHDMNRSAMASWIGETMGPDALLCVNFKPNGKEQIKGKVLELLVVAAALTKYDEENLFLRFNFGEMENLVTNRFRSIALRSRKQQERRQKSNSPYLDKKQVAHTLGLGFVQTLVRDLPPKKRVGDEDLDVILKPRLQHAPGEAPNWTKEERDRLKQITKQVQSEQFQDSMIQVRGDYLYDAIRSRLKQADPSIWKDEEDKVALRRENILRRENYAKQVKLKKIEEKRKELHLNTDFTPDRRFKKNRDRPVKDQDIVAPPPAPTRTMKTKGKPPKQPGRARKDIDAKQSQVENPVHPIGPSSACTNPVPTRLKKNGTPDMRCQSNKSVTVSADRASTASTSTDSERTIFTGPRGGRYYLNASGKKVYIK